MVKEASAAVASVSPVVAGEARRSAISRGRRSHGISLPRVGNSHNCMGARKGPVMVYGTPAGYLHEAVHDHAEHMHLAEQAKRRDDQTEQWRHRALATSCLLAAAEQYLDDTAAPDTAVLRTLFSSRLSFQASTSNARGSEAIHVV